MKEKGSAWTMLLERRERTGSLGCDRSSRLVLLVLTGIRVARNDGRDSSGRCRLASGDQDEELHQVIIDLKKGPKNAGKKGGVSPAVLR